MRNDNVSPESEPCQRGRLYLLDGVPLTAEQQERIDAASERDNAAMRVAMEKWNNAKWRTILLTELRENAAACNRNADAVAELRALLEGNDWSDDA